jgi:hypothetical protein
MPSFISSACCYSRPSVESEHNKIIDEALSNKTYSRRVSLAQTQTNAYLLRAAHLQT